ncbi:MAG: hypothetical protein JXA93_12675 [Anaerolineae bacterium]|nr:hypothetical protein [Anaerolineae bacterium]
MRKTILAALLVFCILSLVLTYPLSLHLATAVEDRQDALLNVWITAWGGHQLLADPLHLFDANIFSPYPRTLAYSELLLGNALFALPITALAGNPVLGYNIALLFSFVLSALGVFLLTLHLTRSPGAGLVAGIAFAFSSYRLTNLAQAQLLTTQWLPFALLSLHLLLHEPESTSATTRRRHAIAFVLFSSLQILSSFYYGLLLALAMFGYLVFDVSSWMKSKTIHQTQNIKYLVLATVAMAAILLPFVLPYFRVQVEMGFERTLADSEPFSASLQQYVMVPPGSVVYHGVLPSDDTPVAGGYPVDALFPGATVLTLAAWGTIRGGRLVAGRARWFFVLLAFAALLLSFGPRLYLAPGEPAGLDAPLPYTWLYAIVPGFKALRAPVRFDVLVSLALAVLAGYGIAGLTARRQRAGAARFSWLAPVLAALVAVEALVWPAAIAEPVPVGEDVPEVYRWLADQPPGVVLELPMAFTPGGPQLEYQYFSTYHWHPTSDGYSGFVPPRHGEIVYEMARFPSERSVRLLQALDVRHVVVHTDRFPEERWQGIESALGATSALAPVVAFGTDRVYRVAPGQFDPASVEVNAYLPPAAVVGQPYTAYVLLLNRGGESYAVAPTEVLEASVVWQGPEAEVVGIAWGEVPLVISPGGAAMVPIEIEAPAVPGAYRVALAGTQWSDGAWSAAGDVVLGAGRQAGAAFPIPARLAAWSLPGEIRAGEDLEVDLTWQALGKINAYYSIYVKLFDAAGNAVVGWDGEPGNGAQPTLLWVPGEMVEDHVTLQVPAGLEAGEYRVEVGMYRAADLARCLTLDRDGRLIHSITLGTVRVAP